MAMRIPGMVSAKKIGKTLPRIDDGYADVKHLNKKARA
jgi:hypothetical protein